MPFISFDNAALFDKYTPMSVIIGDIKKSSDNKINQKIRQRSITALNEHKEKIIHGLHLFVTNFSF